MPDWFTTDVATYLGLAVGVLGLFGCGYAITTKNKRVQKQNQNVKNGNGIQTGDNATITIGGTSASELADIEEEKLKKSHDLRIIEEVLVLLPYEDTLHYVDLSHINGMLYDFALKLDNAESYKDVRFKLYNAAVDKIKNEFIESVCKFNEASRQFLSVDHPNKKPLMIVPPYDWRNGPSEVLYRELQYQLSDKGSDLNDKYKEFVATFKEEGFITAKI